MGREAVEASEPFQLVTDLAITKQHRNCALHPFPLTSRADTGYSNSFVVVLVDTLPYLWVDRVDCSDYSAFSRIDGLIGNAALFQATWIIATWFLI